MGPTDHVCDICHQTFRDAKTFEQHVGEAHSSAGHTCHICNKVFKYKRNLQVHSKGHKDGHATTNFSCPECSLSFSWERSLQAHIKAKHDDGHVSTKHSCSNCSTSFSRERDLRAHVKAKHAGKGKCLVCGKTYSSVSHLNWHMRNDHAPSARCECPLPGCVERFQRVAEVKKHMKSAHPEHTKGCRCCIVDVSATERAAREMVLVSFPKATGELQCVENICDFTTKCIRDMDLHKSHDHGHEVTLACLFCSPRRQWFTERKSLHGHLDRIHNGKRPYRCECGYVSAQAFDDLRHRTACGQRNRCGNQTRKRHINEQTQLNITGESVFERYKFSERILAEGAYGTVYTATKVGDTSTEKFAIKEVGLKGMGNAALEHIAKARTEAGTMLRFRHKNINACLEVFQCMSRPNYEIQLPAVYIVMELHLLGSLAKVKAVMGKRRFREEHLAYIMQQGAAGLVELHRQLVIHGDLTIANVFLNERADVIIGDFGSCSDTGPMAFTNTGAEHTKPVEQHLATKGPERRGYT